jgi:hypothetical protein
MNTPLEDFLQHLEEEAGRLPRSLAYPLILLITIAIWLPIGIVLLALIKP